MDKSARLERKNTLNIRLLEIRVQITNLYAEERKVKSRLFKLDHPPRFKRGEIVTATIPNHGTFEALIQQNVVIGQDWYANIEITPYQNQNSGTALSQMHFQDVPHSVLRKAKKQENVLSIPPEVLTMIRNRKREL